MEISLRASLIAWLASAPELSGALNAIAEEVPTRTALPWLGIVGTSSVDWSTKTEVGMECRVTLELHARGDVPGSCAALGAAVQSRIAAMPAAQSGFRISSIQFLRSRAEQRADNIRALLLEYRFRLFAA